MGPEIIFPAVIVYGAVFAGVGLVIGGIVPGWRSIFVAVVSLAVVAGALNGIFAPSPHGVLAGVVAFVAVFVVVGVSAVTSHLIWQHLRHDKRTAV